MVAERPIDQPGYFTFTDSLGRRVTEDPSGNARIDIPGASVRTDTNRKVVQYDLPRDKYTIDFTGTRSGKALLGVTHGDVNENMSVWRFDASSGVSGTGAYDAGLSKLQYGDKAIQRGDGLGIKSNIGLPKTMAQDSLKTYPVSVTDELGAPLSHAVVNIDTGYFNASAWTDASGNADIRVYGPPMDSTITAIVKAADHVPMTQKLKGGPPGPPDVPDAVRKLVGPEQAVYIPAKPQGGGPLGVIELAAVLALSGAGLTYARTRAG
jgi:hypothetical protein